MSLNVTELAVVCDGLRALLIGGRAQRIRGDRHSPLRFWMRIRTRGESHWLLIATERDRARIHRVATPGTAPVAPRGFIMGLRKRLMGAPIRDLHALPGERIVRIQFDTATGPLALVIELTGRHGNVFLVGPEDRIVSSLVTPRSTARSLAPGDRWTPPPGPTPQPCGLRAGWPDKPDAVDGWLDTRWAPLDQAAVRDEAARAATRRLRATAKRLRRRLRALDDDLKRADRAELWRRYGELLRGAFGRAARGDVEVEVQDWFADDAPLIRVPLDPKLDVAGNIDRYFHRARRAERGGELALERIDATQDDLKCVEAALENVQRAETPDEIESAVNALVTSRVVRPRATGPASRRSSAGRLPFVAYTSSDGVPILVGRGSIDNDRLTFGHARGRDWWLHAADHAGSHVVIRLARDSEPSRATLIEAALLAAWHSRARNDSVVTVHHLRRNLVRKPKGLPPGRVTIASPSAIDVRMDATEVQRVLGLRDVDQPEA